MNKRSGINTATRRITIISLFLSIILVTGTIALSASSSSFIRVDAQADLNLQITQLTTDELKFPTGIDFLAEDDILVIEKNTGQVKRIIAGKVLNEPVLDVNVASESERGLLGIAIFHTKGLTNSDTTNKKFQKNNYLDNQVKVFLFYTETKDIDNGDILGNRLYKYDFINGKLVNPKLLLDLPSGKRHNGGVLELGPDNHLYLVLGDVDGDINGYRTSAQNIENNKLPPDGRAGILRLTVDGSPVIDNDGFSSLGRDSGLLNFYYGYGIRNSFGIAFDPLTDILWETENGSGYGDEINVILPGFNGGYMQIMGLSTEYQNFKKSEKSSITSVVSKQGKEFDRSKLISINGKGTYYDPVFTWAETVAPTAITFIDSKIFGEEYENDLLVGSVNQGGRIFHFNVNETRTGLDLLLSSGELADRMADVDEELTPVTAGRNFGLITDIEINPYDGTIYVVSGLDGQSKSGKIFHAYPKSQQQKQPKQLMTTDITTTKENIFKNINQQKEEQKLIEEQKIIEKNKIKMSSLSPLKYINQFSSIS